MVWYVLSNVVGWNGMSFHSTHATSHALQPMQVVTSMYLQTSSSRCTPRPGTPSGCAEMALIWSMPVGMMRLLSLLELHQEALELGRVRVGVDHGRRQQVHAVERRHACIFRDAAISPVDRDADLVRLLAVDQHRLDALCDHRLGDVRRTRARHLHCVAALDAEIVGEV